MPFGEGGPELVARWLCAACTLAGRYSGAQALRNGTALEVAESLALSLVAVEVRDKISSSVARCSSASGRNDNAPPICSRASLMSRLSSAMRAPSA